MHKPCASLYKPREAVHEDRIAAHEDHAAVHKGRDVVRADRIAALQELAAAFNACAAAHKGHAAADDSRASTIDARPRPHARAFTQVWRKLDDALGFELVGTSGVNAYRDDTVPQGTHMSAYRLVPVRGELVGASAETVVVRLAAKAA